jgi:hypothetical protein
MSALKKLQKVRVDLHAKELKKTGNNNGKPFFELGDFMPAALVLMNDAGLCDVASFTSELASLTVTDTEDGSTAVFTIPMGTADLKGCHNVQNIGASVSYMRRYLLMTALNIIEHDGLDSLNRGETDLEPHLVQLGGCTTLDELKSVFAESFKMLANDKEATKALIKAKDNKKSELSKVAA